MEKFDEDKSEMAKAFDLNTANTIRKIGSVLAAVSDRTIDKNDEVTYWQIEAVREVLDLIVRETFDNCEAKLPGAENFETTYEEDENEFKKHNYDLMLQAIDMLNVALGREKKKADFGLADYGPGAVISSPILPLAIDMLHTVAENYKKKVLEVA